MKRFASLFFLMLALAATSSTAQVSQTRSDFLQAGFPHYEHCHMDLMPSGIEKFRNLEQDLLSAKHYIHIEYYKWYNDSIGRYMLDVLARCVRNGVQVRVLYDAFGNSGKAPDFTPQLVEEYRAKGIRLEGFDPMRFPYVNHALHRMHRKMVVIDGRMVYTGGLNVADYYLHGKPQLGRWGDMHARLTGPIVVGYQRLFADMWYKQTNEVLDSLAYLDPSALWSGPGQTDGGYEAFIVDREPGKKSHRIRQSYISSLAHARHKVRIINPYIILVGSVRKALRQCIDRGVEVEILLGHRGDNLISEVSTAREVYSLARRGAKVWLCQECFHHDKVMIVDDTLCTVGTANLDARSLSFDYEVNAYYLSPEYCRQLNTYFDAHIQTSVQLTRENWTTLYPRHKRRIGWWTKGIRGIL